MPQEIALINEFTIKEMVWFFGTLFSLNSEAIKKRLKFLTELLELPEKDKFIRDCSGGQQRRISFALTLVHEPELLILDEPTVGLDPLLRNRIWEYFNDITKTRNVTVLLSTHYIEEARHSTRVGLMRKGIQIAEDTPDNIMLMMETTNLEEAFLRLSEKQELDSTNQNILACSNVEVMAFQDGEKITLSIENFGTSVVNNNPSNWNILIALLMKTLIKIIRHVE